EIVVGVWNYLPVTPTWGCIKVFEWTGSDNDFGSSPISYFDLGITDDNLYASGFATGDLDNDGKNELVVCENRSNNTFVVSVDGTFETTPTWNIEYNNNITVGSPYAACVGDADNDGFPEFYVVYWDNLNVYTHENTGVDTYSCVDTSGYLTGSDEYSWEGAVVANFDGGYGEVYITSANFGHLWIVTNTGDVSNPTFTQLVDDSPSYMGAAQGDQDHGSGSDGGDLYIGVGGGSIYDYEFTGSDVTNIADYTFYTIFTNPNPRTILMVDVMDSLDADGEHEVVGGADGLPGVESFLFVLEHGEFATHDLGVENISPTYTAIGQSNIEATIFNHGANDESNFNIYWSTDTGDNGSELYSGTLVAQTSDDVALSWTADTTGLVNMTVWTDLAGDENALNDTLTRAIYVYPPATGQYTYKYYTESPARTRGVGVFGNDDFCVGVKNSPYSIEFYHDAPDSPNVINTYWENPGDPGDHIDLIYNWGIGVDNDLNAYLTNQDLMQSVLVFDYDGNSTVHRLELGQDVTPLGTGYPTACDIDDSGYVYVAYYVFNPAGEGNGDQIEVYDKLANWNDATHTAPLMTSFEPAAYVCEGLCVNSDGSVLWLTNRSSPGYLGNVTRWTGSPSTGYVQDTTFAGDGTMDIPGYVRGIDL
ncbi:VCBS repeat-containing protein, partial [bacterium]|nr:VCBS repeat-containing protein [bacterium]